MRIVLTSARNWDKNPRLGYKVIRYALLKTVGKDPGPHTLIEGEARGGDRIGRMVAEDLGWLVDPEPCTPAEWREYGNRAGMIRNKRMLDRKPDHVIGVPYGKSKGTWGCIRIARKRKIPTDVYTRYRKRTYSTPGTIEER